MKKSHQVILVSVLVAVSVCFRVMPHPANISPVASFALLGGMFFGGFSIWARIIPVSALFLSDLILGFHPTALFVYGAMALIPLFSRLVRGRSIGQLAGASFLGSITFFIITNFGHWLVTDMYPKSMSGLTDCFMRAIPFFWRSALGDFIFSVAFASVYWTLISLSSSPEVCANQRPVGTGREV